MKQLKTYLALAILSGLAGGTLHAQNTIEDVTYGTNTPTAGVSTPLGATASPGPYPTYPLDAFTVTAVVGSDVFVEDTNSTTSGVYGEIYGASFAKLTAVGDTYASGAVSVETSIYGGYEEFDFPTAVAGTKGGTITYDAVSDTQLGEYAVEPMTYSPTALVYTPVEFTFTTGATADTLVATASNYITDAVTGTTIDLYKPTAITSLAANTTYTLSAIAAPYYSTVYTDYSLDLDAATIVATGTSAPEPTTWALMGLGLVGLLAWNRRRILSI